MRLEIKKSAVWHIGIKDYTRKEVESRIEELKAQGIKARICNYFIEETAIK